MRFGLNALLYTASFSNDDLDLIPKVAELGYDGIELPFIDLDVIDPSATRRALEAAGLEQLGENLAGPTGVLLGYEDPVVPLKALVEFVEDVEKGEIKSGAVEKTIIDNKGVLATDSLASLTAISITSVTFSG